MITASLSPTVLMQQRVTLKHIAIEAGLSIASVSMALRNNTNISPATIQRVKVVARQLGYVPDPVLSALAEYRKTLRVKPTQAALALISDGPTADSWTGKAATRLFQKGAADRAAELGYSLQHIWAPPAEVSPRRLEQILQTRGIRGLLLAPPYTNGSQLKLDWSRYAVIAVGHAAAATAFDYVEPNYLDAIRTCWSRLAALGHRRIGLVLDESMVIACPESIELAFDQVQRRSADAADFVPALCLTSQISEASIAEWLGQYQPDAIISGHFGLLRMLQSMNVVIPHHCAYVSLHADEEVPGVPGISQLSLALGTVAVDNLHQKLIANICGSRPFTLACQVSGCWQEGWSLDQFVRLHQRASRILCA